MDSHKFKIVVSGDVCIDLLIWKTDHKYNSGAKWERYPQVHMESIGGEALLLSRLVALATGASIISPQIPVPKSGLNDGVLRSTIELGRFTAAHNEKDGEKVYRVQTFLGYTASAGGVPKLLPVVDDDENADMVILDDEDNGFNLSEEYWPLALSSPQKSPLVIYKTNNPSSSSNLWRLLEKYHLRNTIVVINGDDLRAKGVNVSKSLSWEKTALDFVWHINNHPNLAFLRKCRHIIVPFGLEGAIYYRNEGVAESYLYFLTNEFEGGFIKENQGTMYGLTSSFVAGLARSIVLGMRDQQELSKSISVGIREGIVAAQKYFTLGFGKTVEAGAFPNPLIFAEDNDQFINRELIQDVRIRNSNNPDCQACWYIIKDKSATNLADIAYDIVKRGEKSALKFIPIARFGNLKTVDRAEIEGYRSIKNLLEEYVSATNTVRPLSIAVFGTPGSGKSFGVTEIASSIAPKLIEKLSFNLSQFQTLSDLVAAFHKVRDLALVGKVPLVFFDEFDSASEGIKLGWLKNFLAPMQDGLFREGDTDHPIGKAIFVFAGGTSSTFAEFCGEHIRTEREQDQFFREFQNAKGPDFVSRLRGYVNVLGPNQTDEHWDQLFIIRRAMILRALLERKAPHLINDAGEVQIDNGVLRALLKVARYKHETRSMEAILEMSRLSNAEKWEQANLPSKDQLKLHVDEEQFLRHLMHDAFFSEKVETLAKALHNASLGCDQSWEELSEEFKELMRTQVMNIPNALHRINYDIISQKEKPEVIEFTERELRVLVDYENHRHLVHKRKLDKLPFIDQDTIIKNIKSWPEILANSNFKIERLKFLCYCETRGLI